VSATTWVSSNWTDQSVQLPAGMVMDTITQTYGSMAVHGIIQVIPAQTAVPTTVRLCTTGME